MKGLPGSISGRVADLGLTIAFIAACVFLAAGTLDRLEIDRKRVGNIEKSAARGGTGERTAGMQPGREQSKVVEVKRYQIGDRFSVPVAASEISGLTLVFVVSANCTYCDRSFAFYRSLVNSLPRRGALQTLAIAADSVEITRAAFQAAGIVVDNVAQVPLKELKVTGTPTLVLVDGAGFVLNAWNGELNERQQGVVLRTLRSHLLNERTR